MTTSTTTITTMTHNDHNITTRRIFVRQNLFSRFLLSKSRVFASNAVAIMAADLISPLKNSSWRGATAEPPYCGFTFSHQIRLLFHEDACRSLLRCANLQGFRADEHRVFSRETHIPSFTKPHHALRGEQNIGKKRPSFCFSM